MIHTINNLHQNILSVKFIGRTVNIILCIHYGFWSSFGFLSAIYYLLKGSFRREQRSVLRGIFWYYWVLITSKTPVAFLRRNIHRIEKGLVMRPLKAVFAKNYILSTVEAYSKLITNAAADPDSIDGHELLWFRSVLTCYFKIVKSDTVIDRARKIFINCEEKSIQEIQTTPMIRSQSEVLQVSYEKFLSLAMRRHSVRWFLPKTVDRLTVDKALDAAIFAPSACNRMPYEFRLYDDKTQIQKIAAIPMGTAGFAQNIPVLCVIIGRMDYYMSERDRHVPYIDASLAAMQFMLALETLGLASCPINWPDFSLLEIKMSNLLKLKPYERPVLLIALGHPDPGGEIPISLKKSISFIRSWN